MYLKIIVLILTIFALTDQIYSQRIPDPNQGDERFTQWGIMDGNRVRTLYSNHAEITDWPNQPSAEWPKGTGHSYVDGIAVIVSAETIDEFGHIIHPMSTNYREFIDNDPETGIPWGWAPVPGYSNPRQSSPARSDDPNTWPDIWPDKMSDATDPGWPGVWNGFFGKGIKNADLETYFVTDDSPDKEWKVELPPQSHLFHPDPDDTTRGGLGLEVAVRGFQWSHVLAQDVIFWFYEITNEGKTDYEKVIFAQYIDWGIGGTDDSSDDEGAFNVFLDMAFAWDRDLIGTPGGWGPVGVAGYAFLESPGKSLDLIDNDDDGLIDENRTNPAGEWLDVFPYGVDDPVKFEAFYKRPPTEHWEGDEDDDWIGYSDLNDNGVWDDEEALNDDVGSDGIGPLNDAYEIPDIDGTQGNGMPDQGEPNFGQTDKDESDQIGLTGFEIFGVHKYELTDDEENWRIFSQALPPLGDLIDAGGQNLGMFFSSGKFPLKAGQTERFSMAMLFAEKDFIDVLDQNQILNSSMARKKETVQQIYNADYQFAKPPDKPTLRAVPGDKKVVLYWDTKAEDSFDPFIGEKDFEGYFIYKSTEPSFIENLTITNTFGEITFQKPIAQFDLANGISGLHPVDVGGVKFYLGRDSGLRHFFIDTDVINGRTYYYAVVSYDRGLVTVDIDGNPVVDSGGHARGISPSISSAIIKADISGNVVPDKNTAVVTPRSPSAGFVVPSLNEEILHSGPGTGNVSVNILFEEEIKDGAEYEIIFNNTGSHFNSSIPTYTLVNISDSDTLFTGLDIRLADEEIPLFDGLVGIIDNDSTVSVIDASSKWLEGSKSNVLVTVREAHNEERSKGIFTLESKFNRSIPYPADFEIIFDSDSVDVSHSYAFGKPLIPLNFRIWNITEEKYEIVGIIETIKADTLNNIFDWDETILILGGDSAHLEPQFRSGHGYWAIRFHEPEDTLITPIYPQPGDVYHIETTKPFRTGETFQFSPNSGKFTDEQTKFDMDRVAVVPNPYVGASIFEPPNIYKSGRGERRIWFIHLPAECTIRIYNIRGYLVETLHHSGLSNNGEEKWDLTSKDGMNVAYGVYIYHIESSVGEKIGKFALIK